MSTTIRAKEGIINLGGFDFTETPISLIDEGSECTTEIYETMVTYVQNGLLIIEGSELNSYTVICKHIQNKIDINNSIY